MQKIVPIFLITIYCYSFSVQPMQLSRIITRPCSTVNFSNVKGKSSINDFAHAIDTRSIGRLEQLVKNRPQELSQAPHLLEYARLLKEKDKKLIGLNVKNGLKFTTLASLQGGLLLSMPVTLFSTTIFLSGYPGMIATDEENVLFFGFWGLFFGTPFLILAERTAFSWIGEKRANLHFTPNAIRNYIKSRQVVNYLEELKTNDANKNIE